MAGSTIAGNPSISIHAAAIHATTTTTTDGPAIGSPSASVSRFESHASATPATSFLSCGWASTTAPAAFTTTTELIAPGSHLGAYAIDIVASCTITGYAVTATCGILSIRTTDASPTTTTTRPITTSTAGRV